MFFLLSREKLLRMRRWLITPSGSLENGHHLLWLFSIPSIYLAQYGVDTFLVRITWHFFNKTHLIEKKEHTIHHLFVFFFILWLSRYTWLWKLLNFLGTLFIQLVVAVLLLALIYSVILAPGRFFRVILFLPHSTRTVAIQDKLHITQCNGTVVLQSGTAVCIYQSENDKENVVICCAVNNVCSTTSVKWRFQFRKWK